MVKQYLPLAILSVLFVLLLLFLNNRKSLNFVEEQKQIFPTIIKNTEEIIVTSPELTNSISSPFKIIGKVKNSWMFEGSFSVDLLDSNHQYINKSVCNEVTPGSWTSEEMIDFVCDLKFQTQSSSGYLKFFADNPSGLPQNEKSSEIPVKFLPDTSTWKTYTNNDLNISFSCPSNYLVEQDGSTIVIWSEKNKPTKPPQDNWPGKFVEIRYQPISQPFSISKWLGDYLKLSIEYKLVDKNETKLWLGEYISKKINNQTYYLFESDGPGVNDNFVLVKNSSLFLFSSPEGSELFTDPIFNQILSTFKFTY